MLILFLFVISGPSVFCSAGFRFRRHHQIDDACSLLSEFVGILADGRKFLAAVTGLKAIGHACAVPLLVAHIRGCPLVAPTFEPIPEFHDQFAAALGFGANGCKQARDREQQCSDD